MSKQANLIAQMREVIGKASSNSDLYPLLNALFPIQDIKQMCKLKLKVIALDKTICQRELHKINFKTLSINVILGNENMKYIFSFLSEKCLKNIFILNKLNNSLLKNSSTFFQNFKILCIKPTNIHILDQIARGLSLEDNNCKIELMYKICYKIKKIFLRFDFKGKIVF